MKHPETAKRLSDAMAKERIKAQELSEKSGVAKSSISQYLNGRNAPSNSSGAKLGAVLHVHAMYLCGFDVDEQGYPIENSTLVQAVHHEGDYWTDEELEEIERYKDFIKSKRKNN